MSAGTSSLEARKRLDSLIQSSSRDTYASIAALIGRNHAYIQQFIRRGTPKNLHEEDRRKIARHFGIPEQELGALTITFSATSPKSGPPSNDFAVDDYVFVHICNLNGDPQPSLSENGQDSPRLVFRRSWIEPSHRLLGDEMAIMTMQGDSMSPELADGDQILLDLSCKSPCTDGLYALRQGPSVQVKRLSINPVSGCATVQSDNPKYENWPDCPIDEIQVMGRVIWVGRRM